MDGEDRRMLPRLLPAVCLLGLSALFSFGCSRHQTPEQEIRAVIAEGERAAESRDLSGLMALISDRYQGEQGQVRDDVRSLLRGYFALYPSVHLWARIESVEFPYTDMAQVRLAVAAVGRESAQQGGLELSGDLHEVELRFENEAGRWLVTRAEWR